MHSIRSLYKTFSAIRLVHPDMKQLNNKDRYPEGHAGAKNVTRTFKDSNLKELSQSKSSVHS